MSMSKDIVKQTQNCTGKNNGARLLKLLVFFLKHTGELCINILRNCETNSGYHNSFIPLRESLARSINNYGSAIVIASNHYPNNTKITL
jgi:hypothetical protein